VVVAEQVQDAVDHQPGEFIVEAPARATGLTRGLLDGL
jgi:hypothetical protein